KKDSETIAKEIFNKVQEDKTKEQQILLERIRDSLGSMSRDALIKNSEEFLKLADQFLLKQVQSGEKNLTEKKKLIDQSLDSISKEMEKVQGLVKEFEKDRESKFGMLTEQLQTTAEQTSKLQDTTNKLSSALANTRVRGQWGERMAEDILRLAGFVEGVNYSKQKVVFESTGRPDYTFFLPQNLKLNMDVKFPLDNYLKYMEVDNELEKDKFKDQFLKDVKGRVKEVTTKDYINPSDNTIDYVLVFIPNEQVYGFINEQDRTILDTALKNKVIICSPLTLYAILAVIRQAVDNFSLDKTANEILSLFGAFNKQWKMFTDSMEKMGKRLEDAQKEYNTLLTTRRNQLEKPLQKIEDLREQKGLAIDNSSEQLTE
ncbi:DNA recombination protein RmuC, partial [Bacteroidota bacterium]